MPRSTRPRWVVIVLREEGELQPVTAVGTFRRYKLATDEEARWNEPDNGYTATVVELKGGPEARRDHPGDEPL